MFCSINGLSSYDSSFFRFVVSSFVYLLYVWIFSYFSCYDLLFMGLFHLYKFASLGNNSLLHSKLLETISKRQFY